MVEQKNNRNNAVDLFRLVCAVMVVAIHTEVLYDCNDTLGDIFSLLLTRIAVPWFFAVSGYYYIRSLLAGKRVFWHYLKRILPAYTIWSGIYLLSSAIQWGISSPADFFKGLVYGYLVGGVYYHLWFFPALIFAVCVTTLVFRLLGKRGLWLLLPCTVLGYVVGCMSGAYYHLAEQIPGFSRLVNWVYFGQLHKTVLAGLPFFISGFCVVLLQDRISACRNWVQALLCAGLIVLFFGEIILVRVLQWQANVAFSLALYPLTVVVLCVLLSHPAPRLQTAGRYARTAAGFTYYVHPLILTIGSMLFPQVFFLTGTVSFLVACAVSVGLGLLIAKLNRKPLNLLAG